MYQAKQGLPERQSGASMILVLIFVAMLALISLVAFKLFDAYYEHWQIQSVAASFEDEVDLGGMSVGEVSKRFSNKMRINSVRNVQFKDAVSVFKEDGVFVFEIEYERRENVLNNIDAVVVFKETIEVPF